MVSGVRVALALGAVLLLSACVATPPPPATADELAAYSRELRALSWTATGLPGDAPEVTPTLTATEEEWMGLIDTCLQAGAAAGHSWSSNGSDGFRLGTLSGTATATADAQLDFYLCVARYPRPVSSSEITTEAQLDYIYDYYADVLVPCMLDHGYAIEVSPTRVEFHDLAGYWHPYWEFSTNTGWQRQAELEELCGPDTPAL